MHQTALIGITQTNDGRVYAAGFNNEFIRSDDGGRVWENLATDSRKYHYRDIASDGRDIYLLAQTYHHEKNAATKSDGYVCQVFRYSPADSSYQQIRFPMLERGDDGRLYEFGVMDLAASKSRVYLAYSSGRRRRVLSSMDRGETWTDLRLPDSLGHRYDTKFHTDAYSDDVVVEVFSGSQQTVLFSSDMGLTWKQESCPRPQGGYFEGTALHHLGSGKILLKSNDLGSLLRYDEKSGWTDLGGAPFGDIASMANNRNGEIVISTTEGGIYYSSNAGERWARIHPEYELTYSMISDMCIDDGGRIVLITILGDIVISDNAGISWEYPRMRDYIFHSGVWAEKECGLYFGVYRPSGEGCYIETDDDHTTLRVKKDYPGFTLHPATSMNWYSTSYPSGEYDTLIYRSTDGGDSWSHAWIDDDAEVLDARAVTRDSAEFVFITTKGLLFTSDLGVTWSWMLNEEWDRDNKADAVRLSPDNGIVWLIQRKDSYAHSIVRSNPARTEWSPALQLSEDEKMKIAGIVQLEVFPSGVVYAAAQTYTDSLQMRDIIIFASRDTGRTWQSYEMLHSSNAPDRIKSIQMLSQGGLLAEYHVYEPYPLRTLSLFYSADEMRQDTLLLETGLTQNIDANNTSMFHDRDGNAYLVTGYDVFRISVPHTTSTHQLDPPSLPLSIAVPYPHPVSKDDGSATLFIQSKRHEQVIMTVHDLAGRELKVLYEGELGPEGRYITWNTGLMAPGTYLLQLTSAEGVCRRNVVVE